MSTISLIAAIDDNNGLGNNQQLLCHLPADLKHFKDLTINKTIIMGRKTFDSIGRVLPNRCNIIVSRQNLSIPGAIVAHSLDDALQQVSNNQEIMVIGGAELFHEAMPLASRLYITYIHACFAADVFFPRIDFQVWQCIDTINRPKDEANAYNLTFKQYTRKKS